MLIFVTANIFFQLNLGLYLSLALAPVFVPDRSSHRRRSVKKSVLKNFAKFTRKHLCNFLKKKTLAQVFFVNFAKFLRTSLLQNKHFRTTAFIRTPLKIRVKRQKQPLELFFKKELFLKISQISQENTCVEVSF